MISNWELCSRFSLFSHLMHQHPTSAILSGDLNHSAPRESSNKSIYLLDFPHNIKNGLTLEK